MDADIAIRIQSDFVLWRCLHGGPLTRASIEHITPHPQVPWERLRARNVPLLEKLAQVYGGYAVVACDGETVIGSLRFYPKTVLGPEAAGAMCLQQVFPAGASDEFAQADFLPLDKLSDKTLVVRCMAAGTCDGGNSGPHRRKGIGTAMASFLVGWARHAGWSAIEATAYQDLPVLYRYTGVAGRRFWERLGFHVAHTTTEQSFTGDGDFTRQMKQEAIERGIDPARIADRFTMRLEL